MLSTAAAISCRSSASSAPSCPAHRSQTSGGASITGVAGTNRWCSESLCTTLKRTTPQPSVFASCSAYPTATSASSEPSRGTSTFVLTLPPPLLDGTCNARPTHYDRARPISQVRPPFSRQVGHAPAPPRLTSCNTQV